MQRNRGGFQLGAVFFESSDYFIRRSFLFITFSFFFSLSLSLCRCEYMERIFCPSATAHLHIRMHYAGNWCVSYFRAVACVCECVCVRERMFNELRSWNLKNASWIQHVFILHHVAIFHRLLFLLNIIFSTTTAITYFFILLLRKCSADLCTTCTI